MRLHGDFAKWAKRMNGYTQHGNIKGKKKNEIYEAVLEDTGDKELAARVANRQGKPGKQKQGPPYTAPIKGASYIRQKLSELIEGGLADNEPSSKYDQRELSKGIEVELEHTNDRSMAEEIAKDHLEEDPSYYTHLLAMEAETEEKKDKAKEAAPMSFEELYGMVAEGRRLEEQKRLDAHGEHKQQPSEWEDHKQASPRGHGDFFSFLEKEAAGGPRLNPKMTMRELAAYIGAPAAAAGAPFAGLGAMWAAAPKTFLIPGQTEVAIATAKPLLGKAIERGRKAKLWESGPAGKASMQGLADVYNRISLMMQRAKRRVGLKPEGWVD